MKMKTLAFTSAYQYYALNHAKSASEQQKFLKTFQRVIEERIPADLGVSVHKLDLRVDDRILVELSAAQQDNLTFAATLVQEITGKMINANNIPKNVPLMGTMTSVGKVGFGLFVDVGIEGPSKEVLIPLFRLRQQLVNEKKISMAQIVALYGFMDRLPVEIQVTKITYEKKGKPIVEGEFTENYLKFLSELVRDGFEIIFTAGEARQTIKKTVAKRGHTIDIIQVLRLGPLETAVLCKEGTTAKGLMSHIGKYLSYCKMNIFIPKKVQEYWK